MARKLAWDLQEGESDSGDIFNNLCKTNMTPSCPPIYLSKWRAALRA